MALDIPGFDEFVEIGRGGFGVVHRATQTALGRTVAIKVLALGDLDPDTLRRFEREARILGQLSDHPNIVTVHDSGTTPDGRPWVAMAYLPSGSLADRLRTSGPLPAEEVASIGVRVAGALETAHRAGILHRDVKPENILVTSYGEPALADFGIAHMAGGTRTVAGTVTASLAHAPPEVLEGSPPAPSGDVYGLASTLYALLNGRPAFDPGPNGAVSQLIAGIVSRPVPDLRPLGVPEPLAEALELGLARDLEERPGTAAEYAEVLRRAQRDAGWQPTDAVVLDPGEEAPSTPATDTPRGSAAVTDDATRIHAVTDSGRAGDTGTSPAAATPLDTGRVKGRAAGSADDGVAAPGGSSGASEGRRRRGLLIGVGVAVAASAMAVLAVTTLGGDDDGGPSSAADVGQPVAAGEPIFTEGPNSGEGRVIFRQRVPSAPLGATSDGENLFLATETAVEARTPDGGIVRWSVQRSTPGTQLLPLYVAQGQLIYADGDDLVMLNVSSGAEDARLQVDDVATRPVVTSQGVVLAIAGSTIARLDQSGAELWRASKPLAAGEDYAVHEQREDQPVLVSTDFELFALDPDTGDELWSAGIDDPDDLQVVPGSDVVTAALVKDGQLDLRGWSVTSGLAIFDVGRGPVEAAVSLRLEDNMLVLADGQYLTGLEAGTGNPEWQVELPGDLDLRVDTGRAWTVSDFGEGPHASVFSVYSGDLVCGPTPVAALPEWPAVIGGRWMWADNQGTIVSVEAPDGSDEHPYGGDCTLVWMYDLPEDANAVLPPLDVEGAGGYVLDDNLWLTGFRLWDQ